MANAADPGSRRSHLVVRARLGVDYDSAGLDPVEFIDHVAERLRALAVVPGTPPTSS